MRVPLLLSFFLLAITAHGQGVSYHADVAPIIHENCTECHRTGEIGPMPFTSFEEVSAYGEFIEFVTSTGYMPPWTPDTTTATLWVSVCCLRKISRRSAWVDAGKPEGDPADNLVCPTFLRSQVGTPDLILSMPEPYLHTGDMTDQYQVFILPTGETDMTVRSLEVRPDNGPLPTTPSSDWIRKALRLKWTRKTPISVTRVSVTSGLMRTAASLADGCPEPCPWCILRALDGSFRLRPLIQMHYSPYSVDESDRPSSTSSSLKLPWSARWKPASWAWNLSEPFFIPANQVKVFHGEYPVWEDVA